MWNTLREIRKFTPKAEVDRILGVSPVQIEDRPAWDYGGGGGDPASGGWQHGVFEALDCLGRV